MSEPLLRLFFALPCPTDSASLITDWRANFPASGKPVTVSNLHLTLVFLGSVPAERVPQLLRLADSIALPRFELTLDRLALWPEGLLHLAPSHTPATLMALVQQLRTKLQDAGFDLDPRVYRPHVTLARQSCLPQEFEPRSFSWTISSFSLFSSESLAQGLHYRALASWPLQ